MAVKITAETASQQHQQLFKEGNEDD